MEIEAHEVYPRPGGDTPLMDGLAAGASRPSSSALASRSLPQGAGRRRLDSIAREEGDHVRLWSRNGRDWSAEFVAITAALGELPTDCVLDGEAVAHCSEGLPDFHGLLGRDGQRTACLYAFDLLHLRATDLRSVELVGRRAMLKSSSARQDRC
jgi:hypothetical protein